MTQDGTGFIIWTSLTHWLELGAKLTKLPHTHTNSDKDTKTIVLLEMITYP